MVVVRRWIGAFLRWLGLAPVNRRPAGSYRTRLLEVDWRPRTRALILSLTASLFLIAAIASRPRLWLLAAVVFFIYGLPAGYQTLRNCHGRR
jgi:hypothetical protein